MHPQPKFCVRACRGTIPLLIALAALATPAGLAAEPATPAVEEVAKPVIVADRIGKPYRTAKAQSAAVGWQTDFAAAQAEAKRLEQPLLVHFYADWCLPCKRMDREALSNPSIVKHLGRRLVGVKVNTETEKELASRYKIRSLPSDVVLAPDGTVLARSTGYQSPRQYLQQLANAYDRFLKGLPAEQSIVTAPGQGEDRAGQPPLLAQPTSRKKPRLSAPAPRKVISVPRPLLGMDGYNPVALFQRRRWVRGNVMFRAMYKGIEYRLNTEAERTEFLVNPERYAPRLLGCDPVVLHETERALSGSPNHAAYFDGRLYLFVSGESRAKFKQKPLAYIQSHHVLVLEEAPEEKGRRR